MFGWLMLGCGVPATAQRKFISFRPLASHFSSALRRRMLSYVVRESDAPEQLAGC